MNKTISIIFWQDLFQNHLRIPKSQPFLVEKIENEIVLKELPLYDREGLWKYYDQICYLINPNLPLSLTAYLPYIHTYQYNPLTHRFQAEPEQKTII